MIKKEIKLDEYVGEYYSWNNNINPSKIIITNNGLDYNVIFYDHSNSATNFIAVIKNKSLVFNNTDKKSIIINKNDEELRLYISVDNLYLPEDVSFSYFKKEYLPYSDWKFKEKYEQQNY